MIFNFLKNKGKNPRVRFAPSPTGPFHVGGARTALFNYLFAKKNGGEFVLRIEDTDAERSDKRFEKDIVDGLNWLGIKSDEFCRQSERTDIYEKYLKKIISGREAFWCHHTREELAEEKTRQMENKEPPRHVCEHKNEKENKTGGIIRLKGSDKKIKFHDLIRGDIEFDLSLLGDIAIAKDERTPLYNFAVVVDDNEMGITHVIRGEDHISNTPKQMIIQKALGIESPLYAHIPMILGTDRSKLSKRHGATSVNEYQRLGYLADAFINFMVMLGWNPGDEKEIMDKEEITKKFSLEKIQKGGAVFNIEKLNWFNKEYVKKMPAAELAKTAAEFMPEEVKEKIKENFAYWEKIMEMEKTRITVFSEVKENTGYFFVNPSFPKSLLVWEDDKPETAKEHVNKIIESLSSLKSADFSKESVKGAIWAYAEEKGRGSVLWPFRVALTGLAKSPDPFGIAEILGKDETLSRLNHAKLILHG
ncbi:MAG: glutamate--tRNA ligase [Candidatus Pacebacteria bacterium]|nr:glutamate--tRNA ligase [Candidatus Paceibacterota bacterium]